MLKVRSFIFILAALLIGAKVNAQPNFGEGNKYVDTEIIVDHDVVSSRHLESESIARVAVKFTVSPGWHIYWKNSGEAAIPTSVKWQLPKGYHADSIRWPAPYRFEERGGITTFGYTGETALISNLFQSSTAKKGNETITISAAVRWLVCKDICVPGNKTLNKTISISSQERINDSSNLIIDHYDELTVASPESFSKISKEFGFKFDAFASHSVINAGETISAAVVLNTEEGLPGDLNNLMQVFPYKYDGVEIGAASVSKVAEKRYVLTFPVIIDSQAEVQKQEMSGVLVLSAKAFNTANDLNLGWSFPLSIAKGAQTESSSFKALGSFVSTPVLLSYRTKSNSGTKEEKGAVASEASAQNASLWFALASAFLAGMLLNLMPCVLPIISIKVMSFVEHADQPRKKVLASAAAFVAGIMSTFMALAVTVVALRSVGHQLGWGFQFQYPPFVLGLILVVFVFSLGFFDLYDLSLPGMQKANRAASNVRNPFFKNFFDGVLATALSTPCTAPFLGSALAFAFSQPSYVTFLIFMNVGLGLAFPYILLSMSPRFMSLLPKPGNWMYTFRQFMGILLLATVLWLLFVVNQLTEEGVVWALSLLLFVYFCFWLLRKSREAGVQSFRHGLLRAVLFSSFIFLSYSFWPQLIAKAGNASVSSSELIDWQAYSAEALAEARRNKQTVFIDFTADWCITCKANEKFVIETTVVADGIKDLNVLALKGDWTAGDKVISDALREYGGTGVPYYVVVSPDADTPVVLPTVLTPSTIVDALKAAEL